MNTFKPVKTALIGSGMISGIYLENCCKNLKILDLCGCSDLIPERSAKRAEEYGIRQMTNEEILSDPSIELVINTTYPTAHYEVAKAALEAGKHVYTEKMIAPSFEEARELRELARSKGLFYCGAPDTFLGATFQTARRFLDGGLIGTPVAATAILARSYHHERFYTGDQKRFAFCPSGGVIFDMGSYYLTALVSLLGGIREVCGFAEIRNPHRVYQNPDSPHYQEPMEVESWNNAAGALRFENGVLATLMTTSESGGFENGLTIYGTEGRLTLGDPNEYGVPLTLTTKATGCTQLPMTHAYGSGNHRGIGPAEMAYAIRAGRVPRTEEMPVHVLEAAQGICRSGETGSIYRMTTRCGRPAPLPAGYTENPELSLSISD